MSTEEIKKEPDNGDVKKEEAQPQTPPTDFKVAEIWIRSGQIMIDASETFWADRCRALGVLMFCQDIVKTAQIEKPKPKIIPVKGSFLNGVRNIFGRKK